MKTNIYYYYRVYSGKRLMPSVDTFEGNHYSAKKQLLEQFSGSATPIVSILPEARSVKSITKRLRFFEAELKLCPAKETGKLWNLGYIIKALKADLKKA